MVAAGHYLLGADRVRHSGAADEGGRAQGQARRYGRTRGAPTRAAGQVDVDHARGAADAAAAQRSRRAREAQKRRVRRRRRHLGAHLGGRRNRGAAGTMTTILITGFGPFPGAPVNPTTPLVRRLSRLRRPGLADVRLVGPVFTTSYADVDRELPRLIARHRPDALLMFGVATRETRIRIETRARNALALLPDATNASLRRSAILPGGPASRRIPAPVVALLAAARNAQVPAYLSRDAGRYLCNYICWRKRGGGAGEEGAAVDRHGRHCAGARLTPCCRGNGHQDGLAGAGEIGGGEPATSPFRPRHAGHRRRVDESR